MRLQRGRWVIVVVAMVLALARAAAADISTELSASILVFPKVIANGSRDTIIQITNTSNSFVRAHCFYVNAALTDPTRPEGPLNPRLWLEVDFTIALTRQQPTQWTVSRGRPVDPFDEPCLHNTDCELAGIDPGRVPPVVPDFVGELKCIEVDDSGAPLSGNHLKGEATLVSDDNDFTFLSPTEIVFVRGLSKYNAIGVLGQENNGDGVLVLGGGQCAADGEVCSLDEDCGADGPCVFEYNACPHTWILNHAADGAPDLILEDGPGAGSTSITTDLTIVPCTQNFETQIPTTVTLQFLTTNEFESQFSVSTSVRCWGDFSLGDIGATALTFAGQGLPDPQGTMYLQSRIRSAEGTPYGVFMVAEELHLPKPTVQGAITFFLGGRAAVNLHHEGQRPVPDLITVPADQLEP